MKQSRTTYYLDLEKRQLKSVNSVVKNNQTTIIPDTENNMEKIKVKKIHPRAYDLKKQSNMLAGFDLHSIESATIDAYSTVIINTGLIIKIPKGYYGRIVERPWNAITKNIMTVAGIINHCAEIQVIMRNLSNAPITLNCYSKVAQLIIHEIHDDTFVYEVDELLPSTRGKLGFGKCTRKRKRTL